MSVHVKKQFWFFFSLRSYSASIIFRVQELHVSILIPETMILLFFCFCWSGLWEKESNVPTAGDMRDFPAGHGTIDTFLYMLYRFLSMREVVSARCQLNNYQARLWIGCNGLWSGAFLITHLAKWWAESWTWTSNAMQNKQKNNAMQKCDKLTLPRPRRGLSQVGDQTHEQEDEPSQGRDSLKNFFWLFKVSLSKSIYQSSASGYHNFQETCD